MQHNRASGILAHITSLPGPYGIGDIGNSAYRFIDFLAESKQTYWQFLPTGPTSSFFDESPYMSYSAFGGSPLLISPDLLVEDGLLPASSLKNLPEFSPYLTDFQDVRLMKGKILQEAFLEFIESPPKDFFNAEFRSGWSFDYALFMAAKSHFPDKPWSLWPKDLARREESALNRYSEQWKNEIEYFLFEQYIFISQWTRLREYAEQQGVKLFGDLPIYVAYDSVDTWANSSIFVLDPDTLQPTHVSGVPPDYFSETGQKWGNPLYDWHSKNHETRAKLSKWWVSRFKNLFEQVHTVRIDHFRGFESYWAVPEASDTAINGKWLKGPGLEFFQHLHESLGDLDIVAEDLGIITEEVNILRRNLGFPGMKVLQFAFDGNEKNSFLPQNYESSDCIVYTGTHDNETTVGWYLGEKMDDTTRARIKRFANRRINDESPIHHDLIYLAQSSIARLAIFPFRICLALGMTAK